MTATPTPIDGGDNHLPPTEDELAQMKLAAGRTRQEAHERLTAYEEREHRAKLSAKMAIWGIAAVAGAVVVGLLMREEPRRRITSSVRRAADRYKVRDRSEDALARIEAFLHDIKPRR